MGWYYISFVKDTFIGACVVEAVDVHGALVESKVQGCNPGGEAMIVEIEKELGDPPVDVRNVLICDKDELHARFTPWLGVEGAGLETLKEREDREERGQGEQAINEPKES